MGTLDYKGLILLLTWLPLAGLAEMPKETEEQYLRELTSNPAESAHALGVLHSARGLQAIVDAGNRALFSEYERGLMDQHFSQTPGQRPPMRADIERILVQHFDDPVWGKTLLRLIFWENYQSRELFDRLYAHISDIQRFDANTYWFRLVVYTDQAGVEDPLLSAVPKLGAEGQVAILTALAQRGYQPALPEVVKFMHEHRADSNWQTIAMYGALANMGSRDSVEQLITEMSHFNGTLAGDDAKQLLEIIRAINGLPKSAPLDIGKAWAAIPHKEDPTVAAACVTFAHAHPLPVESTLLISRLGDMKSWQTAFEALMGIDSPDVWRDTRAKIEALHQAGTLPEGNYMFAKQRLSQRLDHPDEYRAQQEMDALNTALTNEATTIKRKYANRRVLAQQDPAAYVPYATQYADELQGVVDKYAKAKFAVGLRVEIRTERTLIARTQRFVLHQPRATLATDQALLAMADETGSDFQAAVQAAEVSRYELGDKDAAIRYYEKALEGLVDAKHGETTADIANPFRTWIGHEIDFLKTGQPFSGRVTRDDLPAVGMLWMMGANGGGTVKFGDPSTGKPPTKQEIATALELAKQQPPSYEQLGAAAMQFGRFPNADALLTFLERNDPAHYLSACLLAMYELVKSQPDMMPSGMLENGAVFQKAVAEFKRRTGTTFGVTADARFATPEKTWAAFRAALRKGDRAAAVSCYTGQMKQTLTQLFSQMSDAELVKMAADFSDLQPSGTNMDDEMREYAIVRRGTPNGQAGFVEFVNRGGEWLIESM